MSNLEPVERKQNPMLAASEGTQHGRLSVIVHVAWSDVALALLLVLPLRSVFLTGAKRNRIC
jgi:hypothetical protein